MPYGIWRCAGGRIVLFNRSYTPIFEKLPNAGIRRANPREYVKFVEQEWFSSLRERESLREYCERKAARQVLP